LTRLIVDLSLLRCDTNMQIYHRYFRNYHKNIRKQCNIIPVNCYPNNKQNGFSRLGGKETSQRYLLPVLKFLQPLGFRVHVTDDRPLYDACNQSINFHRRVDLADKPEASIEANCSSHNKEGI